MVEGLCLIYKGSSNIYIKGRHYLLFICSIYVLYYMKLSTLGGLDYWIELVLRNMYLFKLNVRSIEFVVPVPASCFHHLFFYCFQIDD